MKAVKKTVVFAILVFTLACLNCTAVQASTYSKLQNAQSQKNRAENGVNKTQGELEKMVGETASMQTYLNQLNDKLLRTTSELYDIEKLIDEKNQGMVELQEGLLQAKQDEEEQYEAMKKRIQFMYEQGDNAYLHLFFSSKTFADFLNKAEYVEMISDYDRQMLVEYAKLQDHILLDEQAVADEMVALDALKKQAEETQNEVFAYVEETSKTVAAQREEIYAKEQELLEYEKQLEASENTVANLERQLKEESAITAQAAQVGFNDLSSITLSGGDLDLMAAIIYCEAGNQPYVGQVAVGNVVMNRVKSPLFPNTVLEVLYQHRQFSPVGSGRFAVVYGNHIANEQCYSAARDAMDGSAPVGNCLFFRTPIPGLVGTQIGGHVFY